MIYDGIQSGVKCSEEYLENSGLLSSASIGKLYHFLRRRDLTAQSTGVLNTGSADTSNVYQLQDMNPEIETFTAEYATSQTAVELVAAPGVGKRLVIVYGSIRTDGTTGEANLHDNIQVFFKSYFSNFASFAAGTLHVHCNENQALKLTSTQGAKKLYVAVEYYIADV